MYNVVLCSVAVAVGPIPSCLLLLMKFS